STNNPNEGWDGKFNNRECQQDVYAWELTLTGFNGSPYKYSGTVTLVR
ncbi:MAG: gliding motility-associated C-terminal domain-containing protein, partial [Bacteroidia bacterium]|nr:gliding motility-associated C-terminal domain-containing protein [Bacteroidia bacterium]